MKTNKISRLIFGILPIVIAVAFGSSIASAANLDDAAKAYHNADYAKAVEIYTEIAESHGTSAPLLTNLGNCYVKMGDYGNGALCYRRALAIDPADREAKTNLAFVNNKVADNNRAELKGKKYSVVAESPTFIESVRNAITRQHLSNTWAVWGAIFFILIVACAALYIFSRNVLIRKIGFFGGLGSLALSVITIIFAFMAAHAAGKVDEGIITAYKYNLRAEPYNTAKVKDIALTRGTAMTILATESADDGKTNWYKVRLNSDFTGWIESADFEPINNSK